MVERKPVPAPANVGERVKRTILQVGIPAFVFLVIVLPPVLEIIDAELGEHLPEAFRLWMIGTAALLTAVAGATARIMALPMVNTWLSKYTPFGTMKPKDTKQVS